MQKFIKKCEVIGASGISPLQQRRDSGDERPRSKDQVLQEHQRMMQQLEQIKSMNSRVPAAPVNVTQVKAVVNDD